LKETDNQPISTAILSSNRINGTLPDWRWNPHLMNLDLSRNLFSGNRARIAFFSDVLKNPSTSEECRPEFLIQDPDRRSINMIGNRLNQTLLSIIEIGDFSERGFSACEYMTILKDQIEKLEIIFFLKNVKKKFFDF
jgi:hypothetical protein